MFTCPGLRRDQPLGRESPSDRLGTRTPGGFRWTRWPWALWTAPGPPPLPSFPGVQTRSGETKSQLVTEGMVTRGQPGQGSGKTWQSSRLQTGWGEGQARRAGWIPHPLFSSLDTHLCRASHPQPTPLGVLGGPSEASKPHPPGAEGTESVSTVLQHLHQMWVSEVQTHVLTPLSPRGSWQPGGALPDEAESSSASRQPPLHNTQRVPCYRPGGELTASRRGQRGACEEHRRPRAPDATANSEHCFLRFHIPRHRPLSPA